MRTRTIALLVLAGASACATAASAGQQRVAGPVALAGHGQLSGSVSVPLNGRGIRVHVASGTFTAFDTGGALEFGCAGGRTESRQAGPTLHVTCSGEAFTVHVSGRRIGIQGSGTLLGAIIPMGATGTLNGDLRTCRSARAQCRALFGPPPRGRAGRATTPSFMPATATAGTNDIDVDGDGRVTAHDVEALAGL